MNVIINGAGGRMGQALAAVMEKHGHTPAARVDAYVQQPGMLSSLKDFSGQADCIIDFSNHAGTAELMAYAVQREIPVVVCTTGHTEEELLTIQNASQKVPVFHSGNMSLGVAVLTRIVREAVRMFPEANVEIVEIHHNQKLDVPSGTALMLAEGVKQERPEAKFLVGRHENGKRTAQEVGIHSLRLGNTVGVHEVIIDTGTQVLTLKHEARDRSLFAEGALVAAEFIRDKAPGLYNMDHITNQE